jgi:hypothetical protein
MKVLAMEFQKIKRKGIFTTVVVLLGVQCLWGLFSFRNMSGEKLAQGWYQCLYHFPILNAIMMPIIIAVLASRLCDVEHKGQTFKLLETIIPAETLFHAKYMCGVIQMVAIAVFQVLMILTFGVIKGFGGPIPWDKIIFYLISTIGVHVTILLLQQVLSLHFSNQMVPLTLGLLGSLAGLFSMFLPKGIGKLLIWGYYGVMMRVGLNWDESTRISDFYYVPIDWLGVILLVGMFLAIYIYGRRSFARKEW